MLRRVGGSLLLAFWLMTTSSALALDTETTKPYPLKLVIHFANHPLLSTPYFQEQVQRELRDNLQVALGDLAKVEVVRDHPLLTEVEAKGLEKALDGWESLGTDKIHFVLIDFADGDYEIQTRQYDELSGLPSPVVRRRRTAERLLVARTAALMVDQDFGLVGTFDRDGDKVQVTLKGGGLGVPLEHWVKKGEVFAVALIVDQGSTGQRSVRAPWTLLQVLENPQNGVCSCQLWARFAPPFPEVPGVVGYRCLKLGTARAPLRLRLVSDKLAKPLSSKPVQISAHGFQPGDDDEGLSTTADGLVKSNRRYQHVAFVRVLEGANVRANIPVPIVDERTISCELRDQKELEGQGQLQLRRDHWIARLYERMAVSQNISTKLNDLVDKFPEDARDAAERALKELNQDLKTLKEQGEYLRKEAGKLPPGTNLKLEQGDQILQELEEGRQKLERYIEELTKSINKNPKIQKSLQMAEQARRLEDEAEYDQAIELYEKILKGTEEKSPALEERLKKLKEDWKLKDEEHEKARKFIYRTWPKLETAAAMKQKLDEVHKAFETCKKVGDYLSPRKILKVNLAHGKKLNKEKDTLRDNEDDRRTAKTIGDVFDALTDLSVEVEAYLKTKK